MDKRTFNTLRAFCWRPRAPHITGRRCDYQKEYGLAVHGSPWTRDGVSYATDGIILVTYETPGEPDSPPLPATGPRFIDSPDGHPSIGRLVRIMLEAIPKMTTQLEDVWAIVKYLDRAPVISLTPTVALNHYHFRAMQRLDGVRLGISNDQQDSHYNPIVCFRHSMGFGCVMPIVSTNGAPLKLTVHPRIQAT